MLEPYSEKQRRWAFAAESRGEIPRGTAIRWSKRAHRREYGDKPESALATTTITKERDGWPQSKATVKKIGELIKQYSHDPLIRQVATRITKDIPSKEPTKEIESIYQWVRRNIRFRYDPIGIEWVQTPVRTLKEKSGDCDCITTLIGALCRSIGHPVALRTVGRTKKAPSHVSALVWDKKRWISLDPILEGPGDTGAERPGHFAAYAPGPSIIWNLEGKRMIGSYSDYGIPVTHREAQLWQFQPAFHQGVPTPTPDYRYSRKPPSTFGHSAECTSRAVPYGDPSFYYLPGEVSGNEHYAYMADVGAWGFLKKIGKVVGGVAKTVGKVAKVVPGVGTVVGTALETAGGLAQQLSKSGKKSKALTPITKAAAASVPDLGIKKLTGATEQIGSQLSTLAAQSAEQGKALAYLPSISSAVETIPTGLPAVTNAVNDLVTYMKDKDKKALKAAVKKAKKANTAKKKKAALDAIRKITRQEMQKAKIKGNKLQLAGYGWTPAVTFSFSGYGDSDIASARAAARVAVDRVKRFIASVGKAPQVTLPEVKAFQVQDKQLTPDGLYGPNAEAAAKWYLNAPVPAHSPAFKNAVTWKPPATQPSPQPAPKPVAVVAPKPAPKPATTTTLVKALTPKPAPKPAPKPVSPVIAPAPSRPKLMPVVTPRPTATLAPIKPKPTPVIAPKPAPVIPIRPQPTTPKPTPVIAPKPKIAAHPITKSPKIPASKIPALLPTRAEIIKLEIAAARGDKALLAAMLKQEKAAKKRVKNLVKKIKAAKKIKSPKKQAAAVKKAVNTPAPSSSNGANLLPIVALLALSAQQR